MKAIPTLYHDVLFRSGLEADWACTFDHLHWEWQYEPEGIVGGGHAYLPDFYLPAQRVFAEVKGPHNERLNKTEALARELAVIDPDDPRPEGWQIAVILRAAGPHNDADWQATMAGSALVIALCEECGHYAFTDLSGDWRCRLCSTHTKPYDWAEVLTPSSWDSGNGLLGRPMTFQRAPRRSAVA